MKSSVLNKMLLVVLALFLLGVVINIVPEKETPIYNVPIESTIIEDLTKDDFSIINLDTNNKITLGTTKNEVENILGKPTNINIREYSELKEYEYDGLFVIYRNDKIVNLRVNKNLSNNPFRFATIRDIAIGDNTEDIFSSYNDFSSNESWIGCTVYDGESGIVVINIKDAEIYDPEKVYSIYFAKNMSDNIFLLTMMDYKNRVTYN